MKTSKKMLFSLPIAATLVLMSGSPVKAEELNAHEVTQLVSGNTVEGVSAFRRLPSTTYFLPDGTFEQDKNGKRQSGTWHVDGEGKLCMTRKGRDANCMTIAQEGEVWKAYIKPKKVWQGPQHKWTFKKILEGNPHNL